ncbi:MAG: hypothetical protein AAFQ62_01905 [Pseudomonadota bacterium]
MNAAPKRRVRVPGKLMLCGEYAVLAGAPAIVTCVDRYVVVDAQPTSTAAASVSLRGFDGATHHYRMVAGVPEWKGPRASAALVDAVLRTVRPSDTTLVVDSTAFYDRGRKLGLGSSAAVAVALSAALGDGGHVVGALPEALAAHHAFQGGRGSGADLRAVAHGGTIVQQTDGQDVSVLPLAWPAGLEARAIMTTQSADTVDRVRRFEAWRSSDADAPARLERLASSSSEAVAEWQRADAAGIIAAMNVFTREISQIDAAAGLGYHAGGHDQLAILAAAQGCSYKPCGAGGGDFGIALATSREALDNFAAEAAETGAAAPAMTLGVAVPEVLSEAPA